MYTPDTRFEPARTAMFTLLRMAVGLIFVVHGWMKLTDFAGMVAGFAKMGLPSPELMATLAISGEFLGGLGVLVGLFTRLAAFGNLCVMLAAIALVHRGHGLLASNGGWEYPLVLALVSLLFISHGAGPVSIDALIRSIRHRDARTHAHAT